MTNEPAFVPEFLTLSEAVSHLVHKTGRHWDVSTLLGFCAEKHIALHAAVPRSARAVQCEVTDYIPFTIRPVKMRLRTVMGQNHARYRPGSWCMAIAHPITVANVWLTGRGDVAHGVPTARDPDPDMVLFVNDQNEPVRHEVTAADLRVWRETLANIFDKWRELETPRPPATPDIAGDFVALLPPVIQSEPHPAPAAYLKPTKKPGDDWTPADYAELLRQYESLTTGPGAMKGEAARCALGEAWSYAPNSIKPFLTTARKQRRPTT